MISEDDGILYEILKKNTRKETIDLRHVMKELRVKYGKFSETEAILHMMEALVVESNERRGW
jgi:hypothetical protein